jgi:hypothetical protein
LNFWRFKLFLTQDNILCKLLLSIEEMWYVFTYQNFAVDVKGKIVVENKQYCAKSGVGCNILILENMLTITRQLTCNMFG